MNESPVQPMPASESEPPRSKWPTVLGVISLVYALGGLLCNLFIGAWMALGNLIPEMFRGGLEAPPVLRVIGSIQAVMVLILGVMMLLGAIGLLRRSRSAPSLLRKWVVLRLTLILIALFTSFFTMQAQIQMSRSSQEYAERMKSEHPDNPWIQVPSSQTDEEIGRQAMISTLVVSALEGGYPLFLGWWLTRRKILDQGRAMGIAPDEHS